VPHVRRGEYEGAFYRCNALGTGAAANNRRNMDLGNLTLYVCWVRSPSVLWQDAESTRRRWFAPTRAAMGGATTAPRSAEGGTPAHRQQFITGPCSGLNATGGRSSQRADLDFCVPGEAVCRKKAIPEKGMWNLGRHSEKGGNEPTSRAGSRNGLLPRQFLQRPVRTVSKT